MNLQPSKNIFRLIVLAFLLKPSFGLSAVQRPNVVVLLAEVLKSHGYATAHIGKCRLGVPVGGRQKPTPDKRGFGHRFATANNAQPSHKNPTNFERITRLLQRNP